MKGKFYPITDHEGPERESRYRSNLVLDGWVFNAMYRQLYLSRKRPLLIVQGVGWAPGLDWLCSEESRPTWIQSAASRYPVPRASFYISKVELAECHILHRQKQIFVRHVLRVPPVCEVIVLEWKIWHRGSL
jgi:hypothetical protein